MKLFTTYFLISIALLFSLSGLLEAQPVIGMSKEELKVFMKEKHRGFRLDNSVVKQRFNYLKYVNGLRTRTRIFYFSEEDICKTSKQVCEYGEFDRIKWLLRNSWGFAVGIYVGERYRSGDPHQAGVVLYSERSKKELSGNKRSP